MVTDLDTAMQRLADLVVTLTGLAAAAVLLGYGDMARPATPHIVPRVLADVGVGYPARNSADDVEHARETTVLLTAYGEPAVVALRDLSTQLWSDAAEVFAAIDDGLRIRNVGALDTQTALKSTSYEPRAGLTVTIGYVRTVSATDPTAGTDISVGVNGTPAVIEVSL